MGREAVEVRELLVNIKAMANALKAKIANIEKAVEELSTMLEEETEIIKDDFLEKHKIKQGF